MFEDSDMYKVTAETVGPRNAKAGLVLGFVAAVCGFITIIGGSLYLWSTQVIQPALGLAPAFPFPSESAWTVVIAFLVSGAMVAGVSYAAYRRWSRWYRVLTRAIDGFVNSKVEAVEKRVAHLEQHTASLESVNAGFDDIEKRLAPLEPPPFDMTEMLESVGVNTPERQQRAALLKRMLAGQKAKAPGRVPD